MGFKLVRVDTTESCKVLLPLGSHFIGRGKFLDCKDHRVSRQHAELIVTTDSIELKSLHQNPCFFKKRATEDTVIFCKPESQVLFSGDQFGLIPDSYWYEVIFCHEDSPTNVQSVEKASEDMIMNEDTESYDHEVKEDINLSGSIMTEFLESPSLLPPERPASSVIAGEDPDSTADHPEDMDISTHQSSEPTDQPANCIDQPTESNDHPSPVIAEEESDLPQVDHLEDMDISTHQSSEPTDQATVCIDQPTKPNDKNHEPIDQPADSTDPPVETNQAVTPVKRAHSEESSPLDVKKIKTEPVTPSQEGNGPDTRSSEGNAASSDQVVKTEPSSPQDVKPGPSNDQGGSSNDGNINDPTGPPSPAKPPNDPPRERCMYGANCYRKNPVHKATYSHPADPDWGPGERGVCPYGAACNKRDPRHWRTHSHPPAAQPPRCAGKRRRRQRSATPASNSASSSDDDASTLIITGKRARKTVVLQDWYNSDDEDPYGTDESDDWQPPSDVTTSQDHSQSQDL